MGLRVDARALSISISAVAWSWLRVGPVWRSGKRQACAAPDGRGPLADWQCHRRLMVAEVKAEYPSEWAAMACSNTRLCLAAMGLGSLTSGSGRRRSNVAESPGHIVGGA
jgi:hypothetical protein